MELPLIGQLELESSLYTRKINKGADITYMQMDHFAAVAIDHKDLRWTLVVLLQFTSTNTKRKSVSDHNKTGANLERKAPF